MIKSDPGLDQRRYNRPTSSEVAGIWIEDENGEHNADEEVDIRVYTKSGQSHKVKYYYGCYDPLQYVLMFPNGEPGWHGNIERFTTCQRDTHTRQIAANTYEDFSTCRTFEDILEKENNGNQLSFCDFILTICYILRSPLIIFIPCS